MDAAQFDLNFWEGLAEAIEDGGQHKGRIKIGRDEHDVAFHVGRSKLSQQLVVLAQDRPGVLLKCSSAIAVPYDAILVQVYIERLYDFGPASGFGFGKNRQFVRAR